MTVTTNPVPVELDAAWDELHTQERFLPLYPTEWVVRFLGRHFRTLPGSRILDLGCGAGRHSLLADDLGHRAFSFDLSTQGLRATGDRLRDRDVDPRLSAGRFTHLPFADESFDGVVAYGVLYYGDRADVAAGVAEIRRILAPGGWAQLVMRTTDDHRHGLGAETEPGTYVLDTDETNEGGMTMHFLSRADIDTHFAAWRDLRVERDDHTAGGGAIVNSDWIIEGQK